MNDATELSGATTLQTTLADLPTIIDPMIDALDRTEPLTFELFVPDRASNSAPGLLVYISPKPGAKMPPAWAEVLNNANLVWVGANDSGNEVHVQRRVALALAAPEAAGHLARLPTAVTAGAAASLRACWASARSAAASARNAAAANLS